MSQAGILGTGGGSGLVLFLEGNNPVAVGPDGGGIIYIVGGPGVTVTGNAGTHTLTIDAFGAVAATVTTVDATPTLIYTIALANNTAALVQVSASAGQNTFVSAIGITATAAVRNVAGVAAVAGVPVVDTVDDSGGSPDMLFTAFGGDIQIEVVGVAATTYNWRAIIEITYNV